MSEFTVGDLCFALLVAGAILGILFLVKRSAAK